MIYLYFFPIHHHQCVRLRDYEWNFTSRAMSRVGKKYEVQKGGRGNKYRFLTIIYTPACWSVHYGLGTKQQAILISLLVKN
jgi:hypothetical protein